MPIAETSPLLVREYCSGRALCLCGCGEPAPLAAMTNRKWRHVKGRPMRFVVGHNARRFSQTWAERDAGYETACWEWQGYRMPLGYGRVALGNGSYIPAHRLMWERAHGPVPDGLELDHLCRNPPCCNPAHLEPVTHAENIRRSQRARLNWDLVHEIRASTETPAQIAARLGVARRTIYSVLDGTSWKESE